LKQYNSVVDVDRPNINLSKYYIISSSSSSGGGGGSSSSVVSWTVGRRPLCPIHCAKQFPNRKTKSE